MKSVIVIRDLDDRLFIGACNLDNYDYLCIERPVYIENYDRKGLEFELSNGQIALGSLASAKQLAVNVCIPKHNVKLFIIINEERLNTIVESMETDNKTNIF